MSSDSKVFEDFARSRVDSFYANVYPGLLLYAIRWLGSEHSFLAEDCVQNAVLNTWKRRNDFTSTAAIKSFLYTCIKNNILDIQRKHSAKVKYCASLDDDLIFTNSIIDQEVIDIICKTINSLPEKYRVVVEMSFIEGLKNIDIARDLGVSDSSIEKRKAKALELVREKLIDIYGDTIFVTLIMINLWGRLH